MTRTLDGWKKGAALAAVGALGASAWFVSAHADVPTPSAGRTTMSRDAASARPTQSPPQGTGTKKLDELRLTLVERRLAALESATEASAEAPPERELPRAAPQILDPPAIAAERQKKIELIASVANMEVRDVQWARPAEMELTHAFQQGSYPGSEMLSTECKSTFCTIVVSHESPEARDEFAGFINEPEMGGAFVHRDTPDGRFETVGYFVRREHDSPDHVVRME
jgi:hypothetical protein